MGNNQTILLIQDTFHPVVGGVDIHVYQLAHTLRKKGYEVEILTATEEMIRWKDFGSKYLPV